MSAAARFVTLEGGEGAGKSTLAAALHERLTSRGLSVVRTREPGGSPGADDIRRLLVSGDSARWSAQTETLLLAAARSDHLERTILPALASGAWVLCDRYVDSTRAYQAGGHGLAGDMVEALTTMIAAPTPDLTLILDIDPALGVRRSRGAALGEDRFERLDAAFHHRVRDAFRSIAAREPERCVLLDASHPPPAVLDAAWAAIDARLLSR